jgi:hypothetical protein
LSTKTLKKIDKVLTPAASCGSLKVETFISVSKLKLSKLKMKNDFQNQK